ncbi:MAG: KpsF/GutQ family sugar-phosphate isomerase [Sneathiella sp.]
MPQNYSVLAETQDVEIVPRSSLINICRNALLAEAKALVDYSQNIDENWVSILNLMLNAEAPLIVAGIGKSGHIARKMASTFSSLCKPAIFLHAAEASHGDLGVIHDKSVVLILSNSGETAELSDLIHYCRVHRITTIAITGSEKSTLALNSDCVISYGGVEEVCPNKLAPTTSTTLSLAIGDALAVGLAHLMGRTPDDFSRYHPGGKLGKRLLRVDALMHQGDALPIVPPNASMAETVIVMSEKSFGVAIVAENDIVQGVITDGDMRRNISHLWTSAAIDIATLKPVVITRDWFVSDAVALMTLHEITACIVEDSHGKILGLLHIHDCLQAEGIQK